MIIPLGQLCNISFLNQRLNIKKETGAFEWFHSNNLQNITDVINTLTENPDQNVICGVNSNVNILNKEIYSYHFCVDPFIPIFKRRYERFLYNINNEQNIYFVRINMPNSNTTKKEIENFVESIKKINTNIKFKMLLIDTVINDSDFNLITTDIENIEFHHRYFYQKDVPCFTIHVRNLVIENIYKKMLEDIGFDTNDTCNTIFTDSDNH